MVNSKNKETLSSPGRCGPVPMYRGREQVPTPRYIGTGGTGGILPDGIGTSGTEQAERDSTSRDLECLINFKIYYSRLIQQH